MESYSFLLILAIILLSTKICGLATEKVHLPQVVGALISGIILGPSCLGILHETDFLLKSSEIGVILLMFIAGLDTNISELKKTGVASLLVAAIGVLVPVVLCGGLYYFYFETGSDIEGFLRALFAGVVFSATSVSITVETLNEMGKLKTKAGTTILGAALIDDIIGIVLLSVVTGLSSSSTNNSSVGIVLLKILGFFVFTAIVGFVAYHFFKRLSVNHGKSRRVAVWALAFCFVMSYCAETLFGVADITGAFFAGAILSNVTKSRQFLAKKMSVASYLVFSPVFFAGIGIRTDVTGFTSSMVIFALLLTAVAIITKVIGCGIGAKISKLSNRDSLIVGVGMISRGEVSLMTAQIGITSGMIKKSVFPAFILAVVATTLITPILLRLVIPEDKKEASLETAGAKESN
ncbi:MAG: cation:proton antiporter [Clostridia bacterium]|jgi:Kef-type K+ transport system membrane component KefB|nr:cation:proton antiporter [Clostridia bacterium]MCI1959554.1 cation:proton antiporter [Clostridia bacterium]MCI1999066.1 cation:proton antiporter [Clostridia bacterium]MCI2013816.1 cation:proton antiporter [Clostridia bacterium]